MGYPEPTYSGYNSIINTAVADVDRSNDVEEVKEKLIDVFNDHICHQHVTKDKIREWLDGLSREINQSKLLRDDIYKEVCSYLQEGRNTGSCHFRLTRYTPTQTLRSFLKARVFPLPFPLNSMNKVMVEDERIYSYVRLEDELEGAFLNVDKEGNEVHLCLFLRKKSHHHHTCESTSLNSGKPQPECLCNIL